MTNKEISMRLKAAGFLLPLCIGFVKEGVGEPHLCKHGSFLRTDLLKDDEIPLYDAEVLYEWLRGWHRDDPFRSFGIENDGITAFDWGPRDNAKWIEYEDSLATTMAEAILWILEDNDAQTKD